MSDSPRWVAGSSDDQPAAQWGTPFASPAGRTEEHLARYREVVGRDVAELNRLMEGTGVPGVILAQPG